MNASVKELDNLYRLILREQVTGYSDNSAIPNFEQFVISWCDRICKGTNMQIQNVAQDIRRTAQGYTSADRSLRERKVTEIGRMLLSLRDIMQQELSINEVDAKESEKSWITEGSGDLSELTNRLESLLDENPNDVFTLKQLANAYLKQGKLEEADRVIEKALKLNPSDSCANLLMGELLFAKGNLDESCKVFEELLSLKPNDLYIYSKLGTIYRKLGKIDKAFSILKQGLEIDPEYAPIHTALGDLYAQIGRDEESLREYQKALEFDPEDGYAFKGLVSEKTKNRDINFVILELRKILKIPSRSQNPYLHILLANYLRKTGRYEEAVDEIGEALKLKPNSIYFQTQLAFCYAKLGEHHKVIEILEPINRAKSNDPVIARVLAESYRQVGREESARSILIKALYENPNDKALRHALMSLHKSRHLEHRNGK